MEQENFYHMIKEICMEESISCELLSYNWLIQLKKDGLTRHLNTNYKFDTNLALSHEIANDKYLTFAALKSQNVPVIEHKVIFNPNRKKDHIVQKNVWTDMLNYFEKHQKLVIKPGNGSSGTDVTFVTNFEDLKNTVISLFETYSSVVVCPFYEIDTEYRTFFLNGKSLLTYGKYQTKEPTQTGSNWKFNLCQGAYAKVLEKSNLKTQIQQLATQAADRYRYSFCNCRYYSNENWRIICARNQQRCLHCHFYRTIS